MASEPSAEARALCRRMPSPCIGDGCRRCAVIQAALDAAQVVGARACMKAVADSLREFADRIEAGE